MSLYIEASRIISRPRYGGLRGAIYSDSSLKSRPEQLYALVIETLKHQEILNEVIDKSGLLGIEKKVRIFLLHRSRIIGSHDLSSVSHTGLIADGITQLSHPLALVLVHDFLLKKGGIATSTGPLKESILRHKARLSSEFTRARIRRGYSSTAALLAATVTTSARYPRWVRVNTLKTTLMDVLAGDFKDFAPVNSFTELFAKTGEKEALVVYIDPHIPNLLGFPPSTDLSTHPLVVSGALFLQDKASCFPAHLLSPPSDAFVIDGTAAPGNKTTHLAAIVGNGSSGKIFAFERDPKRAKVLETMVGKAGADKIVQIRAGHDFLLADPWREAEKEGLGKVTHLLLDPSCSGSGIVERHEYELLPTTTKPTPSTSRTSKKKRRREDNAEVAPTKPVSKKEEEEITKQRKLDEERLLSLSAFQKKIVMHAMRFPSARRITYSTCSVHAEENEHVVLAVLESDVAVKRGWRVEDRDKNNFRAWERRGLMEECGGDKDTAEGCIRCNPWEDGGIGFFVVPFVRDGSIDEPLEEPKEEKSDEPLPESEAEEEWGGIGDVDDFNEGKATEIIDSGETGKQRQKKRSADKAAGSAGEEGVGRKKSKKGGEPAKFRPRRLLGSSKRK